MKKTARKLLSGVLVGAIAVSSMFVGVMASETIKDVSAQINYSLKMKVDNVDWNPTEADGTAVRPITYNGRTYLPVRALAEKLGVAIDWDGDTQTVLIGEKEWTPVKVDMVDADNGQYTEDPDMLYNGSGAYSRGIVIPSKWATNGFSTTFVETKGKYSTMKLSAYALGGDTVITISDKDTKQVFKTIELQDGMKKEVEFAISASQKVKFSWDSAKGTEKIIFGDISVK